MIYRKTRRRPSSIGCIGVVKLVISGPGSWTRLQNSFLSPYLPVRSADATELGTEELTPLNYWVVQDVSGQAEEPLTIVGNKMPGLKMTLAEQDPGCLIPINWWQSGPWDVAA